MSEKDKRNDENFSPELLHAISANELGCPTDLLLLSIDDVAVLKQILRGEKRPPIAIDKKRAVNALARSERSTEVSTILTQVVADSNETTQVRAAAAAQLSVMPQESAENALIGNLETTDEIVRLEVIKSLAKVGAARALDRLNQMPEPKSEHARKQVSLARQAISFRWRLADDSVKTMPLDILWTTQAAKQVEGSIVRERIEALWGATYNVSLNAELGFEINCGSTRLTVLLNDELKRGAFVSGALSRKMLAGLVVAEEPEFRHLTVRYVIITSPSANGFDVTVVRTNGEVAFVGEVRATGDKHQLNMRDVGLERSPMQVEGTVSDDSIELNVRTLRGTRRPKKHALPVARNAVGSLAWK